MEDTVCIEQHGFPMGEILGIDEPKLGKLVAFCGFAIVEWKNSLAF
jgi:hypothetical protein